MAKVIASLTTSVDGYFAAPNDGPGKGLGDDGERLHRWVFGGDWRYDEEVRPRPVGDDAAWMDAVIGRAGAVVCGRATYEAARHWGDTNPWEVPLFVVTHRPEEQPESGEFLFVDGVSEAVRRGHQAAGEKDVNVMGGGDVIRQALEADLIDELTIITAPLVLGAGKRLFDGFSRSFELEHLGVRQTQFATFVDYRVLR